jgi:hypothetical protein
VQDAEFDDMKIADLMSFAERSIVEVRDARARDEQLDPQSLTLFSTSDVLVLSDVIERANMLTRKLSINHNDGLRLIFHLGADVALYRKIRNDNGHLCTWANVEEDGVFIWYVLILIVY